MVARAQIAVVEPEVEEEELPDLGDVQFLSSGSLLLDLALGGGWARGRICNLVGDRSSGKSLLACEAMANFASTIGKAENARYVDAEDALDKGYADRMGMPRGVQMITEPMTTVEKMVTDFDRYVERLPVGEPGFYCIDSLDALSDDAEMTAEFGAATFGTAKAKLLSKFFRQRVSVIAERDIIFMVVSQMRDKIGVTFGERKQRSGGKALDFYCSQIMWLSELSKLTRTTLGQKRAVGIKTLAKNKKNKVGMPFREAELTVLFNYGIDDEETMIDWLKECRVKIDVANMDEKTLLATIDKARANGERDVLADINSALGEIVTERWMQIETNLRPTMSKYGK